MSNELLTKLMDPLVEEPVSLPELIHEGRYFSDFRNELYTWTAKWYLDSYLKHWSDYEDKGHTELELIAVFRDNHVEELFFSKQMKACVDLLEAIGLDGYYEHIEEDATMPFIHITQHEFGKFILGHISEIMFKIQEIYAARYEAALKEAAGETNESVEQEPEIPEDLKELRDPLNTESIDFFALLPTPVYGATTEVTQDDFIAWFAKNHVKKGRCTDGLSDAFQGICPWFHSSCIKLLCLIGYDGGKEESTLGVQYVTKAALKEFYENNNSKIISKVKEIMKLWLEHGLI